MNENTGGNPFPPTFQVGDLILGRYRINNIIHYNSSTGSHVYDAVALHDYPPLKLRQGDRVVIKTALQADAEAVRKEYELLRAAIGNWWDSSESVAAPIEVSDTCIVTRFVKGQSLREILDKSPGHLLPATRAIRLAHSTLKSLDILHRSREGAPRGVIHRDVKPENIMVRNPGTPEEHAVIIDLGISSTVTQAADGPLVATWRYAAPEQLFSPEATSARSDVFAVGVTLYEMLSGHIPFESGIHKFLQSKRNEEVLLPRLCYPDEHPNQIAKLNDILGRALMMDPNLRYKNAQEMSRALVLIGNIYPEVILRAGNTFMNLGSYPSQITPNTPPDLPGPDPVSQSQENQNANFDMCSDFQAPRQSEPASIPDPYTSQKFDPITLPSPQESDEYYPSFPSNDKYTELIRRTIVHHTPADWKSLIESRTERLAQETVREIYLSCPICHLLYRIFGEEWLDSKIANSINSVGPFILVDREALQDLYDDQNVTLARNHVEHYDAELSNQAWTDAASISNPIIGLVLASLIISLFILLLWRIS